MKRSFDGASSLLYLISSCTLLAGSGHKGEKTVAKSQLKKPTEDSPIQKIFCDRFFGIGLSRAIAAGKKFQGEFDRFIHKRIANDMTDGFLSGVSFAACG